MSPAFAPSPPEPLPAPGLPAPDSVRRVLVCQIRQIGDVLLSTPSIELLARHYPGAEIHAFTENKCLPMLEGNPHLHKVWPLDKRALRNPWHEAQFYRRIAASKFDIVVDFQRLPRCRTMVFYSVLAGTRVRLSFPPPWYFRWLYTHWHQPEPRYAAAFKAGVLAPLGIAWQGERPRLYLSAEERARASALLASLRLEGRRFISLDVTHRHATRRWPARHYAALLDMLAEALPELRFFLPFGPGEEEEVRALRESCRHADRVAVPPRLLSLREMAACIERAALQFGNCSSPRHMAVALDVPSLTVLGSTSPGWTFPSPEHAHIIAGQLAGTPCACCNKNSCDQTPSCLERLTPETVFPRVVKHLEMYGKAPLSGKG